MWGGSYHTSAGVFSSGLYAPNGMSTTYSSAYTIDAGIKARNIENSMNNLTFLK
jgi:hypothetical protein